MKCKACNSTLRESEQVIDPRTGLLETVCGVCITAGLTDKEVYEFKIPSLISSKGQSNVDVIISVPDLQSDLMGPDDETDTNTEDTYAAS